MWLWLSRQPSLQGDDDDDVATHDLRLALALTLGAASLPGVDAAAGVRALTLEAVRTHGAAAAAALLVAHLGALYQGEGNTNVEPVLTAAA